jgi:hypothetical protein
MGCGSWYLFFNYILLLICLALIGFVVVLDTLGSWLALASEAGAKPSLVQIMESACATVLVTFYIPRSVPRAFASSVSLTTPLSPSRLGNIFFRFYYNLPTQLQSRSSLCPSSRASCLFLCELRKSLSLRYVHVLRFKDPGFNLYIGRRRYHRPLPRLFR